MGELKLEIGKRYKNGYENEVHILDSVGFDDLKKFMGDDSFYYQIDGTCFSNVPNDFKFNLVEEVVAVSNVPALNIEVGSLYITRAGNEIKITSEIKPEQQQMYNLGYRFAGGPCGQYYTAEGRAYPDGSEDSSDLIRLSTPPVSFLYTNYEGTTAIRTAIPASVRFGTTEWHPKPGYLISMFDIDRQAIREFALKDCDFTVTSIQMDPDAV